MGIVLKNRLLALADSPPEIVRSNVKLCLGLPNCLNDDVTLNILYMRLCIEGEILTVRKKGVCLEVSQRGKF